MISVCVHGDTWCGQPSTGRQVSPIQSRSTAVGALQFDNSSIKMRSDRIQTRLSGDDVMQSIIQWMLENIGRTEE